MRILLLKTSSMGDVLHTLPALTDAGRAYKEISFDWVIEEAFAPVPSWHPLVKRTVPLAFRRWRKAIFSQDARKGFARFYQQLREEQYDLVLDAQGLIKSAALGWFAKGPRAGLDFKSAREAPASWFYQHKYKVDFYQHAVHRMRKLFSLALHYPMPTSAADFGLKPQQFHLKNEHGKDFLHAVNAPYLVFLFGTTWTTKQWPQAYWQRLATLAQAADYPVMISGNHPKEIECAQNLAKANANVTLMPYLSITDMAGLLAKAKAVVAVDTGFGHLAAALGVPTLSLYGPTDPDYTGALGPNSLHLAADFACAPCLGRTCRYRGAPMETTPACYSSLPPERVWQALQELLNKP